MITNLDAKDKADKIDNKVGNIDNKVDDTERSRLLNGLAFIGDAVFDSYENDRHRQCLENTRVDVLQEINTWAANRFPQPIFWLKGMAGTGKSTIALTTANNLSRTSSCIMASYFFKMGGGELASSRKLLPTLIHQIDHKSPRFCNCLLPATQSEPGLRKSASMKDQFNKLLIGPLRNMKAPKHNFVWVTDALDECDKIRDIERFLQLIAQTLDTQNLPLRVFVTSRPEISMQGRFGAMPQILHHDLTLHKVSRAVVDAGITTFFNHELASIRKSRRLPDH